MSAPMTPRYTLTLALMLPALCACGGGDNVTLQESPPSSPPSMSPAPIADDTTTTTITLSAIKADMTLNEAPMLGVSGTTGWKKGAVMSMGTAPRGDNSPPWWTPANADFKTSNYWNALAPWFTLHKGTGHTATNVRVKIYDVATYVLKQSTNTWERVGAQVTSPVWAYYQAFASGAAQNLGQATPRVEPDGTLSYKFTAEAMRVHGGPGKFSIVGADIKAVFVRMTTQLILDDPKGVDDRNQAQLLMGVGADYYPTLDTVLKDFAPMSYVPNAGTSRHGLVGITPRIHTMATIDPPGQANDSPYHLAGGVSALPVAQFEANPPPGAL